MLTIVFSCPGIARAKGCSDGGSAKVTADLEDVPLAGAREVTDQKQDVHVQHRRRVRLSLIAGALPNFGTPSAFEAVPALRPNEKKRLLRDSADRPQPILARRPKRARM